jgi:1-acyl-sn-glycerol-3-phosphate acyltransferase
LLIHLPEKMLKRVFYPLIALLFIVFLFSTSALFFPIALLLWLLTAPFDKNLKWLHLFTCFWASLYIWIFPPWRVSCSGKEHIDPDGTYIIVSNHQSMVDILAAFTLFIHFKWVSKAELFNIPLIGWNMRLNRYVRLQRGHKDSIRKMYKACEDHLSEGSSVYLFPEGTRSETGKMRPFKEGAFVLAKRFGLPVLPIVINGSKNAVPKNSFNFHGRSDVTLEVLEPVMPDEFADSAAMSDAVRELIRSRVVEEKEPTQAGITP